MFIGEIKNTLYTYNVDGGSFLCVNFLTQGKGENKSLRIGSYNSNKYADFAYKLATSPTSYLELEFVVYGGVGKTQFNNLVFSQTELFSFIDWWKSVKDYVYQINDAFYQTKNTMYPNIGFSMVNGIIHIYKISNTENFCVGSIPIGVFEFIVNEIFVPTFNKFLDYTLTQNLAYMSTYLSLENLNKDITQSVQPTVQTPVQPAQVSGFGAPVTPVVKTATKPQNVPAPRKEEEENLSDFNDELLDDFDSVNFAKLVAEDIDTTELNF